MIVPTSSGGSQTTISALNPEASPSFRLLVFLKHGITFRDLIHQIDILKDQAAHKKLMVVHRYYGRLLFKHGFRELKLRFELDFQILTQGLDFGLKELTPEELAECLDEICPCGRHKHSSEYLKKLRTRMKKACDLAIERG